MRASNKYIAIMAVLGAIMQGSSRRQHSHRRPRRPARQPQPT